MDQSSQLWPESTELDDLHARFPGYVITEDRRTDPPRWSAVARDITASLYSVTTKDKAEMVAVLTAELERVQ